jgi:glyoxalase family protein
MKTAGIHHITAFAGDPQANVDFYAGVLGLRLVKKTINFDAPEIYHLYFGNEGGAPGTIITFFPAPGSRKGEIGGGQVGITTYVIPQGAMPFWAERLQKFGISANTTTRFGEQFLQFSDNEGLKLELVEREEGPASGWAFGGIPIEKAIKGFGGVVLYSVNSVSTRNTVKNVLGMTEIGEENGMVRYQAEGQLGNIIDIPVANMPWGAGGAGTIHHIAWRAKDNEEHLEWNRHVSRSGFGTTGIVERQYFKALYFREEGGILFEIATDPPGFATDEAADKLGHELKLPSWYEPHRQAIEANLLPIEVRVLKEDH